MNSDFLATRQIVVLRLGREAARTKRSPCLIQQIRKLRRSVEQKSHLYAEVHTDTATSPVEPPCFPLVLFRKSRQNGSAGAQVFSEKANLGLGFIYLGYRFGTGCRLVRP